jgi:CRP-like cAMP-binding protein
VPFFKITDGSQETADDRTFLPDATDDDWQALLRSVGVEPFVPDQVLIKAGDPGDCFFILVEGDVAVQTTSMFGTRTVATIRAGSVFGEIAFLDGGKRTATVRALTGGTMVRVSRASFLAIQAWEPQLAQRIALDLGRLCAIRLRQTLAKAGS